MSGEYPDRRGERPGGNTDPSGNGPVVYGLDIVTTSPEETFRVGKALGRHANQGTVLALWGEMGAGKTCLVQGIARGMGVSEDTAVTSPTFTLINEYPGSRGIMLSHFDLYRLGDTDELLDLGYDEYWYGEGISAVEWPDIAETLLPENSVDIYLSIEDESTRSIRIELRGEDPHGLLRRLSEIFHIKEGS
jgi:tRNA threonylcarbamoyladenosine biosynthesis protein TsaE